MLRDTLIVNTGLQHDYASLVQHHSVDYALLDRRLLLALDRRENHLSRSSHNGGLLRRNLLHDDLRI
jgi:hypothetical protein